MTDHQLNGRATLVAIAMFLGTAGCSGGGGDQTPSAIASGGSPTALVAMVKVAGVLQPELAVERDPDGVAYLRVTEEVYNPIGANPGKTIKNTRMGPQPGVNNIIANVSTAEISNVVVDRMKHGLMLANTGTVWIHDYRYWGFDGGPGQIWGAAIKLGDSNKGSQKETYIQRVVADGMQKPDPTYKVSNTDFIGIEDRSGPVYIRDVTGRNFGDAGVDSKSSRIYIMNATLDGGHRMLRAWHNVEIILVNSIVNASPDNSQGALLDTTGTIRYYNTLWCQDAHPATIDSAKCRTTPWIVEGEDMAQTVAAARFIPLSENPLPGVSPFFKTGIDQIVAEYSRDAGRTWTTMPMLNAGGPGEPPRGDTRYQIPMNLNDGVYQLRAYYMLNGVRVGQTSAAVGEDGLPVE